MAEYRDRRTRKLVQQGMGKTKVVMTQWVDDVAFLTLHSGSGGWQLGSVYFDKDKALDAAQSNLGLVLELPCIRHHDYSDKEHTEGFEQCPFIALPERPDTYNQFFRCCKEDGHTDGHASGIGMTAYGYKWMNPDAQGKFDER